MMQFGMNTLTKHNNFKMVSKEELKREIEKFNEELDLIMEFSTQINSKRRFDPWLFLLWRLNATTQ